MKTTRCLLWFTNDLRVHDNPLLEYAERKDCEVMGLAFVKPNKIGSAKDFLLASVQELQQRFQEKNIPFFILKGEPEVEIPKWFALNSFDYLLSQKSFNFRDQEILKTIEGAIGHDKVISFRHQTLIAIEQLPFAIDHLPMVFTKFRKLVEAQIVFGEPLATSLDRLKGFQVRVPEGACQLDISVGSVFPFAIRPGETGALARLEEYFWQSQAIAHYKETRNGMLEKNDSSKISPYLALGALSPRRLYQELKAFENSKGKNESTEWFVLELLWRDYFKFLALKIGPKLFSREGISQKQIQWNADAKIFDSWKNGQTSVDFVDANMQELLHTGWMSNRGRQNVASYLAKSLGVDWTLGAKYFEAALLDDDAESNWGNWQYVAGVGVDPRDRIFNIERQREMYDPQREYCRKWLS